MSELSGSSKENTFPLAKGNEFIHNNRQLLNSVHSGIEPYLVSSYNTSGLRWRKLANVR